MHLAVPVDKLPEHANTAVIKKFKARREETIPNQRPQREREKECAREKRKRREEERVERTE